MANTTSKTTTPLVVKHREVANTLRDEIEAGSWTVDERLPGEQELARRFQVAHMTIRHAVATLVDQGYLIRIRGKGTYIVPKDASPDTASISKPLALLFPPNAQLRDPYYFPEVLDGFVMALQDQGQSASIYSVDVSDVIRLIEPGSVVACMMIQDDQVRLIERIRDSGLQVLAINRYTGRRSIPSIRIDDTAGVECAVEHLVGLGHERIGFICGPNDNIDAADRLRGFRDAAKKHQLLSAPVAGDAFTEVAGYSGAQELLNLSERPTAMVCASDLAALGVIKAAHDLSLSVPHDLSVVGFGDFSVADYMLPRLTTVRQSRIALGRAAGEALLNLAAGRDVANVVLSADLIIRDSTSDAVHVEK